MTTDPDTGKRTIPAQPIPVPMKVRLRQFRSTVVPVLVFALSFISLVVLWRHHLNYGPGGLEARMMAVSAVVRAPVDGTMSRLWVAPDQRVKAGDILATISVATPEYVDASLALLRAELELLRADQDDQLKDSVYRLNRLRLEMMGNKVDLASKQVELKQAVQNYNRDLRLNENLVLSEQELEMSRTFMEALEAEVSLLESMIADLETDLQAMPPVNADDPEMARIITDFDATMDVAASRIRLMEAQLKPVEVRAPIDGIVSSLSLSTGHSVFTGDTVLTIHSTEPDSIVGYIPEPVERLPQPGEILYVRARNMEKQPAEVVSVGAQIQEIPPEHLPSSSSGSSAIHYGLPIRLQVPAELRTSLPGERVNIIW